MPCTRPWRFCCGSSLDGELEDRLGALFAGLTAGAVSCARSKRPAWSFAIRFGWPIMRGAGKILSLYLAVLVAIVVPYLVLNVSYFGNPLPISDWLASSFPYRTLKGFHESG